VGAAVQGGCRAYDVSFLGLPPMQIGTLLDTIRSFDVVSAQRSIAAARHMWTFEYANRYIVRRLATERQGLPLPIAGFKDDPGCDCAAGCGGQC
jgi:hypothetical protein